jgi:hypothetical protein
MVVIVVAAEEIPEDADKILLATDPHLVVEAAAVEDPVKD